MNKHLAVLRIFQFYKSVHGVEKNNKSKSYTSSLFLIIIVVDVIPPVSLFVVGE
jgi:hypothetical protein